MSLSITRPSRSSPPIPAYRNAAIKALSERLEDARSRRDRLRQAGKASEGLDAEILDLRRQLREGGQLLAGDALGDGRYLLVKPAGRGGFAIVWEAYDQLNSQTVAIKVLHSHLAGDPLRRERFFRGARVMKKLAGSGVVQVLDPEAEEGGFHYFVMEFLLGGNLNEAVLNGRLAKSDVLPLMLRVSDAVANAHAMGIIHRDIKPSNILLDGEGNPKLTDFDLVGAQDTTGGTRTGALGTLLYAAPECLDKPQDATARADVYGLAMTTIFCLSGQELARSILRDSDRVIRELPCSGYVKEVLRQAVAWEPAERFTDAAAWGSALRAATDGRVENQPNDSAHSAGNLMGGNTAESLTSGSFDDQELDSPETGSASERSLEPVRSMTPRGRSYVAAIGIDRYLRWPHLASAVSDAQGVLHMFEKLGFAFAGTSLFDDHATGAAMRQLIVDDLAALERDDSLVLFFAGHGYTLMEQFGGGTRKIAYLIPADGDSLLYNSWLRLDGLLSDISRIPARHVLVILDTRPGGISLDSITKWRGQGADAGHPELRRHLAARRSRRIITAALDDQAALDGGPIPGHSLFTACLIEALTEGLFRSAGRSVVTGFEIAQYVQRRVISYSHSSQTPEWGALEHDRSGEMLVRIAPEDAEHTSTQDVAPDVESDIARSAPDPVPDVARYHAPNPLLRLTRWRDLSWWLVMSMLLAFAVFILILTALMCSGHA